jgi:GrpB-like predicted nucleotidyltransferase (UPF0157 family)
MRPDNFEATTREELTRYCYAGARENGPSGSPHAFERGLPADAHDRRIETIVRPDSPCCLRSCVARSIPAGGRENSKGSRGAGIANRHVGSTSVPGLPAKPIIDILLVVADSAQETEYLTALEGAGYKLRVREPGWYEHRMFKGPENDVNLHVFSVGCPEVARMLAFRDRLRTNEADRELYARSKRTLAQREWKYTQNYADAKAPVIEEIMSRAHGRGDILGE